MSAAAKRPSAGTRAGEPIRHFLEMRDIDARTLREIIDVGAAVKRMQHGRAHPLHPARPLAGRALGVMLSKPSTRTRLSFEIGMKQLGGEVAVLSPGEMQLGRGESLADTARVLSRFLDALVIRTGDAAQMSELARWSTIPVINGLTPRSHPVQILADVMTYEQHRGPVAGTRWAWAGDGNNVAASLIEAAARFGFALTLATPESMTPDPQVLAWARAQGADIEVVRDPKRAVTDADCVVTDTWTSMSDQESEARLDALRPYQVNAALMRLARPDALFMHCLPAHIGEEVTEDVFEGPASVVFDEAENRLHAQKGLLLWALGGEDWKAAAREPRQG
ncbi:ornithine carbamoyltransferase [Acidomonas methanolica]|uniref:Ornithine carbamoyltransferase n=2 Tax=Acidomonas methanolica TaxID=437 RepID=A0A023D3K6_ACIMT|nr:ornithine carbamoyltransferase [Acidomonas methanolica]MBU2653943.1 ornithine carbamoyltransferase [Acidomonas methanolica]TCS30904.1 ornithine carbamoyltransferase [Acidomonas methanolica]GAJ28687.1 aspartate/ornithine carbamoyltransferase [Acidomonas methanolica NBRC 104435]GEK98299.1 ornithine carbamoyltransferase [Acidomonas methanolica NBRC 104435]